jgi:ferredoxin
MKSDDYRFRFRTGEIAIDHQKCKDCGNYACIKADSLFGTSVLRIRNRKPVLAVGLEDAKRLCNECLACELYCQTYGKQGLRIELDMS